MYWLGIGRERMQLCADPSAFSPKALRSFVIQIIPREEKCEIIRKKEKEIFANLGLVRSDLW